ncbi:unnamed protein product [Medioppia subpectinata]|uniref:Drebrin-like protein n=1 Tax=Medioppia subpectinata TaxID=1979941 RepID=A0A7R9L4R1_9ACAR|nr:unnamed protein product [Medioppia subpectinata]CAG2115322.1 unnamed protein product [Medioppia subpectinata]
MRMVRIRSTDMSVNFYKNRDQMVSAYKDVVNEKSDIDWALFGYEKQTNDLTLVDKGSGGLEELFNAFNASQILYAFCSVKDPNTDLLKYVLINWQGEGAPLQRKGICINHFRDVCDFFKGSHITINARIEEEVEPEVILSKITKVSAKMNLKDRSEISENISPVGTNYRRVQPQREISQTDRENFWAKTQEEERLRLIEDKKKLNENRVKSEKEREEREVRDAKQREQTVRERDANISVIRESEKNATNSAKNVTKLTESLNKDEIDDNERRKRSENIRRERAEEVKAVIPQSSIQKARALFEQNSSAGQMNSIRNSYQSNNKSLVSNRKELFESNNSSNNISNNSSNNLPNVSSKESTLKNDFIQKLSFKEEVNGNHVNKPIIQNDVKPEPLHQPIQPIQEAAPLYTSPLPTNEPIVDTINSPIDEVVEEEVEEEEVEEMVINGNHNNTASNGVYTRDLLQETYIENHPLEDIAEEQTWDEPNNGIVEDEYDSTENVLSDRKEGTLAEVGLKKARALFDYQAADETEISFDPDDLITHIEQIDSGWWQGLAPDGTYGLFPANYVELID